MSSLTSALRTVRNFLPARAPTLAVQWVKTDSASWLGQRFTGPTIKTHSTPFSSRIEQNALATNERGAQPLWEGYGANNRLGNTRLPDQVRTQSAMGNFYTRLVTQLRPKTVVEFGTAFGVSGMYFLAGLETNLDGHLFTFEPNAVWAELARANLRQISSRYTLTVGTFEDNVAAVLPPEQKINLAFIDAIHTSEFVRPQLELVLARCASGAIILLDDITFSDDMKACWSRVSTDIRFRASLALDNRVGLVEVW